MHFCGLHGAQTTCRFPCSKEVEDGKNSLKKKKMSEDIFAFQ